MRNHIEGLLGKVKDKDAKKVLKTHVVTLKKLSSSSSKNKLTLETAKPALIEAAKATKKAIAMEQLK